MAFVTTVMPSCRFAALFILQYVCIIKNLKKKNNAADGNVFMISESKAEILTALRQKCGTEDAENSG